MSQIIKYVTEVFIGDDYAYIREGEGMNEGDVNTLTKLKKLSESQCSPNNKLALIKTNRPAQFALYRAIHSFFGAENNDFAFKLKNKFIDGDVSYLNDLEQILQKQQSLEGFDILLSKNPLIYSNTKLILNNMDLKGWYSDINTELNKQDSFQIKVLKASEPYLFLTNLK